MPRPSETHFGQHVTNNQKLDNAVHRYWQTRFPGKPGRVLIVDRTPIRKAA